MYDPARKQGSMSFDIAKVFSNIYLITKYKYIIFTEYKVSFKEKILVTSDHESLEFVTLIKKFIFIMSVSVLTWRSNLSSKHFYWLNYLTGPKGDI